MTHCYSIFLLLLFSISISAQNDVHTIDSGEFQFGVAGKLQVEFNFRNNPNFKLSVAAALGYDIDKINLFPTLHTGIILFNKGPIGSQLEKVWYQPQLHFFYSALVTLELDKRDFGFHERYVPLYHFSDFSANPLHNPFKSSFTYGAVWVRMPKGVHQRIGLFNSNIAGRVQITYINDGGPVLKWMGDKHDRYYTGGVVLSYHGNTYTELNLIELSYHKFTGYTPYAFDVGDKLQIDYLLYADKHQLAYNQQRWKINISNIRTGFGGNISFYNFNSLDLQDFLHFTTNVPYHPDYYRGWRIMVGGRYEKNDLFLTK